MKRLFFAVLMMVCSVSWAEWKKAGSTDSFYAYYDKSTIRRNGKIVKMWQMKDYFEEQDEGNGKNYKSQKLRHAFNCMDDTAALITVVAYSGSMGEGKIVFSGDIKEEKWDWDSVVPGSVGEAMLEIACSKK